MKSEKKSIKSLKEGKALIYFCASLVAFKAQKNIIMQSLFFLAFTSVHGFGFLNIMSVIKARREKTLHTIIQNKKHQER